jgi:glycosyltransferase involved in cell wall biosynthesis
VRLPSQIGLIAAGLARRLGKPWATEVVACPWDQLWNHGNWQAKVLAPIQWARMRRIVAASPYTLYVSRSFLQRRYPTRGTMTVVSNVEIPRLDPSVLDARLRRIGGPRERLVIGMIGSIQHRYKGIGTAIEALAQARDRLPAFEFRVLGQGDPAPWRQAARLRGLDRQVRFCGVRPSGQPVLEWLDDVDLYLQPSFQEGLPRALIEAMSRGCPALASTAGGIPELLPPACLHRPGDAARLATLIVDASHDSDWQQRQARRNFREVEQYVCTVLDARRTEFWRRFAKQLRNARQS